MLTLVPLCVVCSQEGPVKVAQAKSGWEMDSKGGAGPAAARRRRGGKTEPAVTESVTSSKHKEEDDNDVVIIPDLEDEGTSLALQVAETAKYQRKVPSIQELDSEIHMALPSAAESGVDLSVLQSYLTPATFCKEEDETWDMAWELQNIASEMAKEQAALDDKEKKVENEGAKVAAPTRVRAR